MDAISVIEKIIMQTRKTSKVLLLSQDAYTCLDEDMVTQKENCNQEPITEVNGLKVMIVSKPGQEKLTDYVEVF